jgi:deazaflavin-dependent oxidoreductase (nitroreductase family)
MTHVALGNAGGKKVQCEVYLLPAGRIGCRGFQGMDLKAYNQTIIEEFRANGGKVGGDFAGAQLLLLTTTGAKTGLVRTNPLAYLEDGGRYVIVASYAGAPTNPPWYYNLIANPHVSVEIGTQRFEAEAEVIEEPERSRLFRKMMTVMPGFADYQRKTARVIPVIALRRR